MRISKIDAQIKNVNDTEAAGMAIVSEARRVGSVLENVDSISDNLDEEFSKKTGITNATDMSFLFVAIAFQTLRWVLMPQLSIGNLGSESPKIDIDDRLNPTEKIHSGGIYDGKSSGAYYEIDEIKKYKEKNYKKVQLEEERFYKGDRSEKRSWIELLTQPVPYDAMNALDKKYIPNIANLNSYNHGMYSNISGKNHHVATLGHDPVLGWIFGTMNILTSTITMADFQSYRVLRGTASKSLGTFEVSDKLQFSDQRIDYSNRVLLLRIVMECIESIKEDPKRLPAAVVRQAIHMESDKYCKQGLPIPLLSTIDSKKAQKLIESGWNSEEFKPLLESAEIIGKSATLSALINLVLEAVYLFCMREDDDLKLRQARIKKILLVANYIALTSNVIISLVTENYSKLDVGGAWVILIESFRTPLFISKIKEEFIAAGLSAEIMGTDDWMSIAMKEKYYYEQ